MRNTILTLLSVFVISAGVLVGSPIRMAVGGELQGSVTSANGDGLYGIVVTAREADKTYATSVFTDERGNYIFPPMESGNYQVWAQAAGFTREKTAVQLNESGQVQQDFTLGVFKDIGRQLTGSEWIANLPEDTKDNHRMKLIFRNNCVGCHTPNFVLQNRFDEDGWRKIITTMETLTIRGEPPGPDSNVAQLIRQYRDELAAYLAKVRGPGPMPMELKAFPRPRGEAARVVITEYDYTSGLDGEYVTLNGSDWTEGVPSVYQARGPHDVEPDPYGYVWVADSQADRLRNIARLDPKTGEVRNYKVPSKNGMAATSHGLVIDLKGHAWINADGVFVEIDPKTDTASIHKPPEGVGAVGGTLDVDNNGVIWASSREGAISFNPATQTFTDYKSEIPGRLGRTYGVAVDSQGNGWWAQMAIDTLGVGDGRTGKVTDVNLDPVDKWDYLMTEQDKELFNSIGSDWNSATPWAQGPRRLGAEKNGNYVWIANYWGNNLARIDIRTHEVTHIDYPNQSAFPGIYDTTIDKHGMVWMNMMIADTVARYDPKKDQWTEFRLPTLGIESRFIAVDNYKDQIEVWVPSYRT
ncbi:MAG: streptogramin lyase/mono/diheme cytochrome c family protein, partial [Gammaproteobacteria bacterium]